MNIDLNEAAKILKVKKRWIYDVTNVLEGAGLLEKAGINKIKFHRKLFPEVRTMKDAQIKENIKILELENLKKEENELDNYIF